MKLHGQSRSSVANHNATRLLVSLFGFDTGPVMFVGGGTIPGVDVVGTVVVVVPVLIMVDPYTTDIGHHYFFACIGY